MVLDDERFAPLVASYLYRFEACRAQLACRQLRQVYHALVRAPCLAAVTGRAYFWCCGCAEWLKVGWRYQDVYRTGGLGALGQLTATRGGCERCGGWTCTSCMVNGVDSGDGILCVERCMRTRALHCGMGRACLGPTSNELEDLGEKLRTAKSVRNYEG